MMFLSCITTIFNIIKLMLNIAILNIKNYKKKKYDVDINNDSLTKKLIDMEDCYKELNYISM